jgi:hypothetical protein
LSAPGKHQVAKIVIAPTIPGAPAKVVVKKQSVARRRKKRSGLSYVFFVIAVATYFAKKYYQLKKATNTA